MYAIVATGGKQYRVEEGQTLQVERVAEADAEIELRPVMVVDGDDVLATPSQLEGATVSATVVEEVKGAKIDGFVYKSKTNNRRRYGHRQTYSTIKITGISRG
ncbi:MAG: 50S ribosomal protein L21 [Actinomycetota bacterium]